MTRKRRYLISAAVLVACVCIALGVLAMLPPRPGVTKANFDRIEKGMTKEDVREIFAGPPHSTNVIGDRQLWFMEDEWTCAVIQYEKDIVCKSQWHADTRSIEDRIPRWIPWPGR